MKFTIICTWHSEHEVEMPDDYDVACIKDDINNGDSSVLDQLRLLGGRAVGLGDAGSMTRSLIDFIDTHDQEIKEIFYDLYDELVALNVDAFLGEPIKEITIRFNGTDRGFGWTNPGIRKGD